MPTETVPPSPTSTSTPQPLQGVESLIRSLDQRDAEALVQSIGRLEEMGTEAREAVPTLLDLLAGDENPGVRSAAAKAVSLIGYQVPEVFPALLGSASQDQDAVVRAEAHLAFLDAVSRRRGGEQPSAVSRYMEVDVWGQDPGAPISFSAPNWIAVDADDNLYITEFFGNRVQKISAEGALLGQWGSEGEDDGQFRSPTGIAIDFAGNVYVSESGNHRVQKFSPDGAHLTTWGSQGSAPGQFRSAMGIAVDADYRVYVADNGNHRVQVFDSDGEFVMAWGEPGSELGQLQNPIGVSLDGDGNLWVAEPGNGRVQRFTVAGEPVKGWDVLGLGFIPLSDAQAVTAGASGEVLVSSVRNGRVLQFDASGEFLGDVAEGLAGPHGTAFDSTGALYLADTFNGVVRKLRPVDKE